MALWDSGFVPPAFEQRHRRSGLGLCYGIRDLCRPYLGKHGSIRSLGQRFQVCGQI